MRSRINAVVILAAAFIAFTGVSSAKGFQSNRHQLPTAVLTAGPGPMCFPDSGCGYTNDAVGEGTHFSAAVLLTDGGGPMCPIDSGCGPKYSVFTGREHLPAVLLAAGSGPMCPPDSGCEPKYSVFTSREHLPAVLLAAGPGPMCPPDSGCGYNIDALAGGMRFRP
jgi:hypothetical protein